jgi:hypothetical protein
VEEVLETEHYERILPACLLVPVVLRSQPTEIVSKRESCGMPVVEFSVNGFGLSNANDCCFMVGWMVTFDTLLLLDLQKGSVFSRAYHRQALSLYVLRVTLASLIACRWLVAEALGP